MGNGKGSKFCTQVSVNYTGAIEQAAPPPPPCYDARLFYDRNKKSAFSSLVEPCIHTLFGAKCYRYLVRSQFWSKKKSLGGI